MKKILLSLTLATTFFAGNLTAQNSQPAIETQEQDTQAEQVDALGQAKKFFASKAGRTTRAAGKIATGMASTCLAGIVHGGLFWVGKSGPKDDLTGCGGKGYFTAAYGSAKMLYSGKNFDNSSVNIPARVLFVFGLIPALPLGLAALYSSGKDIKKLYFDKTDEAQETDGVSDAELEQQTA